MHEDLLLKESIKTFKKSILHYQVESETVFLKYNFCDFQKAIQFLPLGNSLLVKCKGFFVESFAILYCSFKQFKIMQIIKNQQNNLESSVVTAVVVWGIVSFLLGYYNTFSNLPMPVFGILVVVIQVALILLYMYLKSFRDFADNIPLKSIALFHAWRIFAGWIFIANTGSLSQTFINNAAYGDIIAGFIGLGVFIFGQTKGNYLIFNMLGILDFVIAVGTGLTLTIMGDGSMAKIIQLPIIMIPIFGVPLSGITHIISLNRLFKAKDVKLNQIIK